MTKAWAQIRLKELRDGGGRSTCTGRRSVANESLVGNRSDVPLGDFAEGFEQLLQFRQAYLHRTSDVSGKADREADELVPTLEYPHRLARVHSLRHDRFKACLTELLQPAADVTETIILLATPTNDIVFACSDDKTIEVVGVGGRSLNPTVLA